MSKRDRRNLARQTFEAQMNDACGWALDLGMREEERAAVAFDRWLERGGQLAEVSDGALKAEWARRHGYEPYSEDALKQWRREHPAAFADLPHWWADELYTPPTLPAGIDGDLGPPGPISWREEARQWGMERNTPRPRRPMGHQTSDDGLAVAEQHDFVAHPGVHPDFPRGRTGPCAVCGVLASRHP